MAKLRSPLLPNQVARLKGVLDYYIQRGQPIVRSWPQKRGRVQTPAERLAQCWLLDANAAYSCAPKFWTDNMFDRLQGYTWARRDYYMSFYLNPVGGNALPGADHHPPQPPNCPFGNGHYFQLLDAYAIEAGVFSKTMFFVFDQPLKYELQVLRRHPGTFDLERTRQGVLHRLAPLSNLQPEGLAKVTFPQTAPNTYSKFFSQVPGVTDNGIYWAYFRGFNPITNHPAISLTPWFQFTIPPRFEFTSPRAASGITIVGSYTGAALDPISSTREPRALDSYEDCRFRFIH